ncbi:loricrin, putative [Trichomonas vaginalis G3]|uniref:receptor protein-tyrosine kinase n=1 Tax=Trichomonas vaginalis (strain ATCC PRA-98 / G3) TaxID=412133 RepID=A2FVN8_TRIV3|nr:glycine-rich protein family [Trichomonas vaginalis G3]EAX91029.1 loricrin, putative [Trichomonas vaginalis G3]KAI5508123.1 glycine-rich protein family [Trichomonas vaginalis G3]|eukprot:XP_001303959.1 loricrin [Trichomonas vaginalis G3]
MVPGGYGGGGYAANWHFISENSGAGSGGGQTCVKFDKNDLWHRVIVSGGGGGSDNTGADFSTFKGFDDGSGGSGGGFTAQGYWQDVNYFGEKSANSRFGFSFGYGESAQQHGSLSDYGVRSADGESDRPGAGAGWFGGFAGMNGNAGSEGGSSWALTRALDYPKEFITAYDSFHNYIGSEKYGFDSTSPYFFDNVRSYSGVWEGDGQLVITILCTLKCSKIYYTRNHYFFLLGLV